MAITAPAAGRARRGRLRGGRLALNLFLLSMGFLFITPVLWGFFTSFKPSTEIQTQTPTLLPQVWTLANYARIPEAAPFVRFFLNSVVVSVASTLFIIVTCTTAGYVFAKYRFRGKDLLFFLVIATILIPLQTYIIPLYVWIRTLSWLNTYQGILLPLIIMSSGIFFLRQSISTIPDELIDAARVDGASEFYVLWRIVFPLSTAPIAAISIVNWVYVWSQFIWPLIVATRDHMFTMEVGLMYFQRQFITEYGPVFAATMITILPVLIVFLIFRTQIIEGISTTGMKG